MKLLVIGSGGREHALAWKLAQSPRVTRVYVAPGNAGTATEPGVQNVAIAAEDVTGLLAFAQREAIDLTVVGPEAPLVAGVVDAFALPAGAASGRAGPPRSWRAPRPTPRSSCAGTPSRPPPMRPSRIWPPRWRTFARARCRW